MNDSRDKRPESGFLRRWAVPFLVAVVIQLVLAALTGYLLMERRKPERLGSFKKLDFEAASEPTERQLLPMESRQVERTGREEIEGTEQPVGQIVDLPPPEREELPDRADYSARYAMKAKKEMKARFSEPEQSAERQAQEAAGAAGRKGLEQEQTAARTPEADRSVAEEGQTSLEAQDELQSSVGSELSKALAEGFGPASLGRDPFDNVKSIGKSPYSEEFLPRIGDFGSETMLNALPYRYIGFFERVKDAVRREWDPNSVYRLRDPTGQIFGYKDRMTILRVMLDARGRLLDASVLSTCGLQFLDDEAKRAMWAAAPFSNPPEGLLSEDQRIRFEFGFIFLIASSRQKLFWRYD